MTQKVFDWGSSKKDGEFIALNLNGPDLVLTTRAKKEHGGATASIVIPKEQIGKLGAALMKFQ